MRSRQVFDKRPMLNREHGNDSSLRVFWSSVLVAAALHVIIAFVVFFLNPPFLDTKDKTIPVLLLSADSKASQSAKSSSAANAAAAREYLATLGQSDFITPDKAEKTQQHTTSSNQTDSSNISEIPSSFPSISTASPSRSQATRAQIARQGLHDIFEQQQEKQNNEIKQLSTRSTKQLDEYEQLLIKQLVKAEFYDQYHGIMAKYGKAEVSFEVVLTLFQNGAIKSAGIGKSSNINEIDQLAIKTAYKASPYPAPPKKDIERGFKYTIPISYHKQK